jgi:hypothetical protein
MLDTGGRCYFSPGSGSPNALFRIDPGEPARVTRLFSLTSSSSLQVLSFDPGHIYVTSWDGIQRRPFGEKPEDNPRADWFRIEGEGVIVTRTLILGPSEVIVQCISRRASEEDKLLFDRRTFLFDRSARAFWRIAEDELGPMAISWDRREVVRYDDQTRTLRRVILAESR